MQTGQSVGEWRDHMTSVVSRANFASMNKYSGYVYDSVWLYAYALDRLIRQNKSYVQDIHSDRSINEFVKIIRETEFNGVTGKINFLHGHARLSNIKVRFLAINDSLRVCFLDLCVNERENLRKKRNA